MRIELYEDAKGEWRWRMKARNGRIVAISGEGFNRKRDCESSVIRVRQAFSHADPIRIEAI